MADPEILGHGDLDVVDVATVPDRLEDAVGEPQHLEVLHRLLAEVVVEAEHLRLVERRGHLGVQLQRRFEVVPERLLDHQPGRRIGAGAQPDRRQPLRDLGEEARSDGQVEDALGRAQAGVVAVEPLGQVLEQLRVAEVPLDDLQPGLERLPGVLVEPGARVGLDRLAGRLSERVHVVAARHADHAKRSGSSPASDRL